MGGCVCTEDGVGVRAEKELNLSQAGSPLTRLESDTFENDVALPPTVEATLVLFRVSSFDVKAQCAHVDFAVLLDWLDPRLVGQAPLSVDWSLEFVPRIVIHNALSELEGDHHAHPTVFDPERGWARLTSRFRGEIALDTLDMRAYPFDEQILRLSIRVMRHGPHNVCLQGPEQLRPSEDERYRQGHVLTPGAVQLDQWEARSFGSDAAKMTARQKDQKRLRRAARRSTVSTNMLPAPAEEKTGENPVYDVDLKLRRRCDHAMWNLCLPIFLLTSLSFVVFAMEAEDVSGRLQITLTLLLTLITFKQLMANELPISAYLTLLDRYVLYSIVVVFSNGAEHAGAYLLLRRSPSLGDGHALRWCRILEMTWVVAHAVFFALVHTWLWRKWQRNSRVT